MENLKRTLETNLDKVIKAVKVVDKVVNGAEKQLVLEIGSYTTKLIEYVVKDNEIEVTGGVILNSPVNAVQNDRVVEIDTLANVLEQALKEERITTKEFVVSIASKEIIIREMNVPNMKEKELKSFVQINSNDIFPVKLSNYVLAYHMIEKGKTNRIMIAAIPKDIVEPYIHLGNRLGLRLKGINYSGYELYNFLDYEVGESMSAYLAFDVGAQNTNIVIISNGVLKFNKIIPKGLGETTSFISEEFKCSLTRAEQLKRQYSTIVDSGNSMEESIVVKYNQRCVDNVLQDVQRIIEFFNSNNSKNGVKKIYILGVAGKINGIEEYVTKKLNVETKALKTFNKVAFTKKSMKLKSRQQSFINCFGVHKLKDRNFYFIKGNLGFKKLSFLLKTKFHKLMLCAILVFVAVIVIQDNSIKKIESTIASYNNFVEANRELRALKGEVDEKARQIEVKREVIDELGNGFEKYVDILNQLDKSLSEQKASGNISVVGYKFQKKNIEIRFKIQIDENNGPIESNYYDIPFDLQESLAKSTGKTVEMANNSVKGNVIEFGLKISVQ